ncbi:helix-turn-helix transcriptional regulator [Streptomyces sp. NPDC000594]|uniref:helix-turn-helix domain-containing protein n=1 Tax=Streptomyces sp. NPDC000594 TaxID=3154261 RepID=UPI00332D0824
MSTIMHFCMELSGVFMFDRHVFAARRIALALSVDDLAQAMGVAPSTVHRWESGATSPSLTTLVLAARHLRTSLLVLVKKDGSPGRRTAEAVAACLADESPK